jgi:lipopolysaccharide/colanic/teichoic acid biosynthesis glycosyltransferase
MFKIPDDPCVTPFGRFLRRYSLDELPQLINVWMSEMSLLVHSRSSSTRTGTFPSGRASDSISGLG